MPYFKDLTRNNIGEDYFAVSCVPNEDHITICIECTEVWLTTNQIDELIVVLRDDKKFLISDPNHESGVEV